MSANPSGGNSSNEEQEPDKGTPKQAPARQGRQHDVSAVRDDWRVRAAEATHSNDEEARRQLDRELDARNLEAYERRSEWEAAERLARENQLKADHERERQEFLARRSAERAQTKDRSREVGD